MDHNYHFNQLFTFNPIIDIVCDIAIGLCVCVIFGKHVHIFSCLDMLFSIIIGLVL